MNLFMIIPLLLVLTTGLWEQTMAQENAKEQTLDTGNHHVMKRATKRQAVPTSTCTSGREGQVHPVPANGDMIWICRSGEWIPFELLASTGTARSLPGKSCKHIRDTLANQCSQPPQSGLYWVKVAHPCSGVEQTMQIYCDMTTHGGGWSLVWKHSYRQVSPLTTDMYYHSSFYKPCTDLSVGWCNVPNKTRLQPEEMMIAAYHNGILVYAYKGTFNRNIDHHWTGGILLMPVTRIVDRCTRSGTGVPTPKGLLGLAFTKGIDGSTHTDTIRYNEEDERWDECFLPSSISSTRSSVQMTMAIYVR